VNAAHNLLSLGSNVYRKTLAFETELSVPRLLLFAATGSRRRYALAQARRRRLPRHLRSSVNSRSAGAGWIAAASGIARRAESLREIGCRCSPRRRQSGLDLD